MYKFNILENIEYKENGVNIKLMFESEASKEIRIVFKKGQIMKDHQTSYPISVEIFEGEIEFGVKEKTYTLKKGDIVSLEASVMHNLKANENSIVRLSLSKNDKVARVQSVKSM